MIRIECPKCKSRKVDKIFADFGWEYKCKECRFQDEYGYFAREIKNERNGNIIKSTRVDSDKGKA